MKKTSHFLWTLGIALFIFYYLFKQNIVFTFLFSFVTASLSSLPDIDIKAIKRIHKFNKSTFYVFYILTIPFQLLFKHRTWTHALWFPILFVYFGEFVFINEYSIIFRILYLSFLLHIFEDSLTISGIKPFYPIDLTLRFAKFNTASNFHFLIFNILGLGIIISFIFIVFLI